MSLFSAIKALFLRGETSQPSRDAGSFRGTISTWRAPRNYTRNGEISERDVTQARAQDLYVNDWAARSVINGISTNTIGSGLAPQARLPWKRLGIKKNQARELESAMEWLWSEWQTSCHARGTMDFRALQLAGFRSILRNGEMLHLPVLNPPTPLRRFSLGIQDISPRRLATPADKISDLAIRDGIELSPEGRPVAYWIATPRAVLNSMELSSLPSSEFTRVPAMNGHRPGAFHLFFNEIEEQTRGVSILSPGIKLFRHLSDAITHEVFGQVVSASLPLVVETEEENVTVPDYMQTVEKDGEKRFYNDFEAGTIYYLNKNERLKPVESSRPSPNFLSFCELVIRALAASADMPYEAVMKDFSKTNYSSARASLLEAWRVFLMYRAWFAQNYCQPVYNMVIEEAYLRGFIELPKGAPDFYEALPLWTNATWIGPARGYVDPVKEATANINLNTAGLKTRKEIFAEQGRDFEEATEDLIEEAALVKELQKAMNPPAQKNKQSGVNETAVEKETEDSNAREKENSAI